MAENKLDKVIANITDNLEQLDKKTFNVYFFVFDTQGHASGELSYIYRTAFALKEMGYNVAMLYQLTLDEIKKGQSFVGVGDWMGDKYMEIKHYNIETDNVPVAPCDFMFIPEIFADVMQNTTKLPCKRIAILHNFHLLQTYMPYSKTWADMGIRDAVAITERQKELLGSIFTNVKTQVVRPSLGSAFEKSDAPREMTINIVARNLSDIKRVTALFYWKYPYLKWVSFNELTDITQDVFAENLKKAPFTVWLDDPSNFGYSALEAMKCGSIVIGKVPDEEPEWMFDDKGFRKNGIWFYNINEVHGLIAGAVNAWINDRFPAFYQKEADKTADNYSQKLQNEDIKTVYVEGFFEDRKKELEIMLSVAKKNKEKEENTETNE